MALIQINVNDETLKKAEMVLEAIGMDVEIAFGIFMKRVVMEEGLPFSTKVEKNVVKEENNKGEDSVNEKAKKNHKWTDSDCMEAIILYENKASKKKSDEVARKRGIAEASMWMAVQNAKYLGTEGKVGLAQYSSRMKRVWEKYKSENHSPFGSFGNE